MSASKSKKMHFGDRAHHGGHGRPVARLATPGSSLSPWRRLPPQNAEQRRPVMLHADVGIGVPQLTPDLVAMDDAPVDHVGQPQLGSALEITVPQRLAYRRAGNANLAGTGTHRLASTEAEGLPGLLQQRKIRRRVWRQAKNRQRSGAGRART